MQQLKKFLNEDQDPKAVEKIFGKVKNLLTNGEEVEYMAVQERPAGNVVVTTASPNPNTDNTFKRDDPFEALQKLKMLFVHNLINQHEFDSKKAKILF